MIERFHFRLIHKQLGYGLLFLLVTSLLLISYPLSALDETENNSPFLRAILNKDSETIGGIVDLRLTFRLPDGAVLVDPPAIKGLENLTTISISRQTNEILIRLLVDTLGTWKTGQISLAYTDKEGNPGSVKTDPVSLTVQSNLGEKPEEAQLRPIRDIIPSKPFWVKFLPWTIGLAVLILAGVAIFLWLRARSNKIMNQTAMTRPHEKAKNEIEQLEALQLFEKGDVKGFYFRFSEIMRRYLENLRNFPAAEYTTEEIASCIREEKDRILIPLLRQADLAKFAHNVPSPARKEDQVKTALLYIDETGTIFETGDGKGPTGGRIG